jgi:hypothetical protein
MVICVQEVSWGLLLRMTPAEQEEIIINWCWCQCLIPAILATQGADSRRITGLKSVPVLGK